MSRQSNVTSKSDLSATDPRGKGTTEACKLDLSESGMQEKKASLWLAETT